MKKTRTTVSLTQRVVKKLLHRPQVQVGYEIAVTSESDPPDGRKRGKRPDDFSAKLPSLPKQMGTKQ